MKRDREFAGSGKLNHISLAMMDSPRDPLKGGFLFLPAVLPREAPAIKSRLNPEMIFANRVRKHVVRKEK